jgi:RNA polymerase sigma factor (TIGR02999 family)
MKHVETITALLKAYAEGDHATVTQLFPILYDELHTLAHRQLNARAGTVALNTTTVVHEAYLKLQKSTRLSVEGRAHFFALAARTMRQIVTDHARRLRAAKRGGEFVKVTLDEGSIGVKKQAEELLALDSALQRLEDFDERLARVVECRFFAGLTEEESAAAMGCSVRTVRRHWLRARAWLRIELEA